jgi:hypothetical protein
MDYEMNLEAQLRQAQVRRLANKLASNRSKKRVVRKLPRAFSIVRARYNPVHDIRSSLNTHKVGGYALLMGMALAAFILDFNESTLNTLADSVGNLAVLPAQLFGRS